MFEKQGITEQINGLNAKAFDICEENPQKAIEIASEAKKLSQSGVFSVEPYERGLACSSAIIATAYSYLGDYSQAIELGRTSLALAQKIEDIDAISYSLEALGTAYRDLEDWSSAIETQLQRLEIAHKLDSKIDEAHTLNRLGSIYSHMGRYEDALKQYAIALPIFEAAGDTIAKARIHHNSCIEYTQLGQYDKALEHGLLGLKFYTAAEPTHIKRRAKTHIIVADVYGRLEQYDEALQHCEIALDAIRDDGISYTLMSCQFTYGQIHSHMGQFNDAIAYFSQSIFMGEELKTPSFVYESHHKIAEIYKKLGNFEQALHHYVLFHEIKENYFSESSYNKVRNLEILHRTRETQRELEQQKKLREDDWRYFDSLAKMKDEVLHSVSHDLKSPLSSILTATYFLRRHGKTSDEKGVEVLGRIESSANQMQLLISNILDLARLETGRSLETKAIQFLPFLKQIIREHELQANQRTIVFENNFETDAEIVIEADKQLLHRAIANLLSNAIKYTDDKGTIEIVLNADNEEMVVAIRDDGMGIAKEDLPHIFERFYRAKHSSSEIEGTGLGLSIAHTIFEQHGGRVWVNSMEGIGTTFSFALPLVVAAAV